MKHSPDRYLLRLLALPLVALVLLAGSTPPASAQNYVTILYETWSNLIIPSSGTYNGDVADMLTEPGYVSGYNWWGKPYYAATHGDGTIENNYLYYLNGSPTQPNSQLIDYHAGLLTNAGVDFITIDFTNGAISQIVQGAQALCNRFVQRQQAGLPIPQIAFFVDNATTLQTVENTFYSGQYPTSLFFSYQGKPLALVATPNTSLSAGDPSQPYAPTGGIFNSFTCRHCWALNNSGSFWQFKTSASTPPPACTYNGVVEEMCAPFACQSSYMTTDGQNPAPGAQGRNNGAFFNVYMTAAQQTRPTFTFITGWNEWASINFNTPPAGEFVDQWKENYSSDAEPEALTDPGSHGYQYYDLMAEQVARLKGTFPVLSGHVYRIVNLNSGLNVDDPSGSDQQGLQMQQYQQNGANPQNWTFTDLGGGYWEITNEASGLALAVSGASTTAGAAVDQESWTGATSQQWSLRPEGNGTWLIVNRNSALVMAVNGMSTSNGGQITQWTDNGTPDHDWRFENSSGQFQE